VTEISWSLYRKLLAVRKESTPLITVYLTTLSAARTT